ncbi:MAG: single-stranded-DNA-specific exonuclease RecJ, partial [Anaerolineae bacterium]
MEEYEEYGQEALAVRWPARRRWQIAPPVPLKFARHMDFLPPLILQLLYNRGVSTAEEIEDFLACRVRQDNPFQLAGMNPAVARIRQAIKRAEPIAVYGDFDADGVTATALLVETLSALGAQVRPYIPHRIDEGYGLNCEALRALAEEGTRLVITVDCGIRSLEEVAFGRRLGLDIIVTDHHHVGERLPPALACINPRRPDSPYPFHELSGVGVAYKLAQALLRVERQCPQGDSPPRLSEEDLLDLVALGTVADLVPLVGENRALVALGMRQLNQPARVGVQALLGEARLSPGRVNSSLVSWVLAPRLNAAGRLDSAMLSYALLAAQEPAEAARLARQLGQLNRQRQQLTQWALQLALSQLMAQEAGRELLFFAHPELPQGIVGLVAGRLVETFYRPAIVVELGQEFSHGSARSIPEFHITQALDECSARGLLVRHGGHAAAAGFTAETARLEELAVMLQQIAGRHLQEQELAPTLLIDAVVDLQAMDWATLEMMHQLEPFGYGNQPPLLVSRHVQVLAARAVGADGRHLKLTLSDGARRWDAIAFGLGAVAEQLPARVDIAYHLQETEWNGPVRLQLNVQDIRPP